MATDSSRKACAQCRTRKVRCDGERPVCGACSKAYRGGGDPPCDYNTPAQYKPPSNLERGTACLPCRRKKRRCNGERPVCSTCSAVGKANDCSYGGQNDFIVFSRYSTVEAPTATSAKVADDPHVFSLAARTVVPPPNSAPGSFSGIKDAELPQTAGPLPNTDLDSPLGLVELQVPQAGGFAASGYSSPLPDGVEVELLENLDEYRKMYLNRAVHCCLSIVNGRVKAIYEGDLSGTVVHPTIIHVAHIGGFLVWQEQHSRFSCGTEEYLLRIAEDALVGLESEGSQSPNWFFSCIYVYTALASCHMIRRSLDSCLDYLRRATNLVNSVDIESMIDEFLASEYPASRAETGPYAEAISTAEEIVCAIAKVAFFDWSMALSLGRVPFVNETVATQFARLKDHPAWRSSSTIMRTYAAYLLHESLALAKVWFTGADEDTKLVLQRHYWQLLRACSDHAALLDVAVVRTAFGENADQNIPLQSGLLTVLSAKALLHHLLTGQLESRQRALDTVRAIHGIVTRVGDDAIPHMDHVIGIALRLMVRIILWERRFVKDKSANALADDAWITQTVRDLTRVLLHSEVKLPLVVHARDMPYAAVDEESAAYLYEMTTAC